MLLPIINTVSRLARSRWLYSTGENICVDGGMTKLMIYHGDHGEVSEMKKKKSRLIPLLIVLVGLPVMFLVLNMQNRKPRRKEDAKKAEEVLGFIKESVFDYTSYDFSGSQTIDQGSKPAKPKNVVLVQLRRKEWSAYSTSGMALADIKTKDDLEKIDVIAFAISEFQTKWYRVVGTSADIPINSEQVTVLLYNTKEKKFFAEETLPYHELPTTVNTARDYTHSVQEIETSVKKVLGIEPEPLWKSIVIALVAAAAAVALLTGIISAIKSLFRIGKKSKKEEVSE